MPTTRVYASQSHANLSSALCDVVRFLINDHPSITGPNWTFVELYTGAAGRHGYSQAITNRHDLDQFPTSDWTLGTISAGDWVVLESADANNTNHFQLYIEMESTTAVNFMMIPYEDFLVAGADASPPFFPTSSFGNASGTFSVMTLSAATAGTFSVIADEGCANFVFETTGQPRWVFAGELSTPFGEVDTRCYALRRVATNIGWNDGTGDRFVRMSPFDGSTVLTTGNDCLESIQAGGPSQVIHDVPLVERGRASILPVGLFFDTTGHRHFAGWFRNNFSYVSTAGGGFLGSGTVSTPQGFFMHRSNTTAAQICFSWNSQSFGSQSLGNFAVPPQMQTGSFSFYTLDTFATGTTSSTGSIVTISSLPSGSFDRNRLRVTYPFNRRKPRVGIVTG